MDDPETLPSPIPLPTAHDKHALEAGDILSPRFDGNGLLTVVTVRAGGGEILMVAHMNREALQRTLASGEAWYWSRSRGQLWRKGETSGQRQAVREIRVDCDQDCLLLLVEVGGDGGACHTGHISCFYRRVVAVTPEGARLETIAD